MISAEQYFKMSQEDYLETCMSCWHGLSFEGFVELSKSKRSIGIELCVG